MTRKGRGWLYTCGIIINRLVPESFMRFRPFVVLQLSFDDNSPRTTNDRLQVVRCLSDEQRQAAAMITSAGDPQLFPTATAYLVKENDRNLGGVWIASSSYTESDLGVRVDLDDDQAWLFAASVAKEARGKGVYRTLLTHVLREHEGKRVYCSINRFNKASMAAHRRFTDSHRGTATVLRIGSSVWATAKGRLEFRGRVLKIST